MVKIYSFLNIYIYTDHPMDCINFFSILYMSSFRMTHKEKRNNPPENSPCFGSIMALCSQVLGTADASGFCIHRPGISNDGTQRSLLEQFVGDEGLLPIFFL